MRNIFTEVKEIIDDYKGGTIDIVDGLPFSQYKKLRTIEFYSNSAFENGKVDKKGWEKPFYNIVNANVRTAVVATDIDRKDINVEADTPNQYDKSFLLRRELYNWMSEAKFGVTLNKMGETEARYGGVLVKKTIKDVDGEEKLCIDVVEWKNTVTDPQDILNGVIIEKHWMSLAELSKKDGVWKNIADARKLSAKKNEDNDSASRRVEIWEIHGEFPKAFLKGEAKDDDTKYVRQYHVLAVKGNKHVELWSEEEDENPYKYHAWEEVSGRSLGRGVVEEGEEAQVWTNDVTIAESRLIKYASKLVVKSTSKKYKNTNAITDFDNGHVIDLEQGADMNVMNLTSNSFPQLQYLVDKWMKQYDRSTSITDSIRGETPPSGQAFKLGALVAQQSGSTFDYKRESRGLFLEEIFIDWVIPFLAKKLNKAHILSSDLFTAEELQELDNKYAYAHANKRVKENLLKGRRTSAEEYGQLIETFKGFIAQTGGRRFFDIPKDHYKDLIKGKPKVTINTTNEQKNKMAILESLSSIFQAYLTNPVAVQQDPFARQIFSQILELSGAGISPIHLGKAQPMQQQQTGKPEAPVPDQKKVALPGAEAITNG